MLRNTQTFLILTAIVLSFVLISCSPKVVPDRAEPRKTFLSASPVELLEQIIERNKGIASMRSSDAKLEYRFTFGTRAYSGADLVIGVEKPGKVFARGSAGVAGTVFTLISDGKKFWAEVPNDKEVYTGSVDKKIRPKWGEERELWENFKPNILLEALLIDDLGGYDERSIVTQPDFYIIELFDRKSAGELALRRQIWIEREGLTVRRHRIYSEDGDLMTEAWLYRYVEVDGLQLPEFYRIERYWEELSLHLTLSNVRLNDDIDDGLFMYEDMPAGYKLIDLDEEVTTDKKDAESGESEPAGS